jgi:hypothetical protein
VEKTFRTVVIYFAIKKLIKYAVAIYVAMCLVTLGCMHILMYNIFVHQSGGRVMQIARVGKGGLCRQEFAQDFSFKIHLFLQNVLQNLVRSTSESIMSRGFCYFYVSNIYRHLFEMFRFQIHRRGCFHHRSRFHLS